MKRVISVFLPTLSTDRLRLRLGAPARDVPFVTVSKDGTRRILAAVDENAHRLKLEPGQTLAHAQAMFPDLAIANADESADLDLLTKIALAFLQRFSPIVALNPPNCIWLDATGCTHLFGGEENLLTSILALMRSKNIKAKVVIADTTGCAFALAKYMSNSFCIVTSTEQNHRLYNFPIASLRVPPAVVSGLAKAGFLRIGQLYKAPRGPLVKRFGHELILRLDQALGQQPEPLTPIEAQDVYQAKRTFPEPVANPDYIANVLSELLAGLCKRLEKLALGIRQLDLIFQRMGGGWQGIRVGAVSASRDGKHLERLFHEHMDKVSYGFGIESLTLVARRTEAFSPRQLSNDLAGDKEFDLSGLIDVLNTRLGSEHIYKNTAVESDVPERSIRRVAPLTNARPKTWPPSLPRPTRLLRNPEKVEAMALLPDHAPKQFTWRNKSYRIKRADGPERIFGEWWKDTRELMSVRDYFQVEDETGARFWLFRRGDGTDPRTGSHEWFMHGFFG